MANAPFVDIAPDNWVANRHATLTYRVPAVLDSEIDVGQLVWAPLRRKLVLGIVVERHNREPPRAVQARELHARVEPAFCLSPLQWRLTTWIAEQTLAPIFDVASLMFPPGARDRAVEHVVLRRTPAPEELAALPDRQRTLVELLIRDQELSLDATRRAIGTSPASILTALERAGIVERVARVQHRPAALKRRRLRVRLIPEAPPPPERAPKQRAAYAWLATRLRSRADLALPLDTLLGFDDTPVDRAVLTALAERGCVALEPLDELLDHPAGIDPGVTLTDEQRHAWATIRSVMRSGTFQRILLHGVTGSGKTELYLRAAGESLLRGKSAIVLVPEIALSGQIAQRFQRRFGDRAVVLHSALDDRQRSRNWERAAQSDPLVVVGPRSALFAPVASVGVIVVDEEHEPAYKQDSSPRYHARSVAEHLAALHCCTVVMGSATPDVETFYRSQAENWQFVSLTERVGRRVIAPTGELAASVIPLPETLVVDMRAELRSGNPTIFSRRLTHVIESRLAAQQQVILFLNRRGASTLVQCRSCGDVRLCPYCDVPLVYHRIGERLACHRCGHRALPQASCEVCGSATISYLGAGAQRVEFEVAQRFPTARVLRWDQDALRRGVTHEDLLARMADREVDILVGTQMIAKGLDLSGVGAVGVINADTFLYLPDIRAAERTFQMLTQVAGRAGRRTAGGEVVIQTYSPQHYAVRAAAQHDYLGFYREEIAYRRNHGYPPFRRLVRLLYRHQDESEARHVAERIAAELVTKLSLHSDVVDVDLLGPAPAFAARVRGRYGWQILLRGADALRAVDALESTTGWVVDVDPVSLL